MAEVDFKQLFCDQANSLMKRLRAKTRDGDLSMDIVQDAFVRMLEHQRRSESAAEMRDSCAYLHRTANNLLVDHYRNRLVKQTDIVPNDDMNDLGETSPAAEEVVMHQQRLQRMRTVVMSLSPRTRQVFQLCRLHNKSYAEAAEHLDISVSSVQKHLTQALNCITDVMSRDE